MERNMHTRYLGKDVILNRGPLLCKCCNIVSVSKEIYTICRIHVSTYLVRNPVYVYKTHSGNANECRIGCFYLDLVGRLVRWTSRIALSESESR